MDKAVQQMQRYNCGPCRKRKSKCDRAKPCMSCVLRSTEASCYTDSDAPASGASAASTFASTSSNTMHNNSTAASSHTRNGSADGTRPSKVARYSVSSAAEQQATSPATVTRKTSALQSALDKMTTSLHEAQRLVTAGVVQDSLSQWGEMIEWDVAETLLPPEDERQEIFHCFFNDLGWYQTGIHSDSFERMWNEASRHRRPLPRHRLALVCTLIAFTTLLAPRSHPASRLSRKPSTDPRWQIENARMLIEAYYNFPAHEEEQDDIDTYTMLGTEQNVLFQLQAETLFCYYLAVAGLSKKHFLSVGRAIHLARGMKLFDEARWTIYDDAAREERRGIAWDLIVMDRWCSLHIGIAGQLMSDVNVRVPRFTDSLIDYRNRLVMIVKLVFDYMQASPAMEMSMRVAQAYETDAEVVRYYNGLPEELQFDHIKGRLNSHDARVNRNAGAALTYYLSYLNLRQCIAQHFLMDPAAPIELRFASLQHARSTIENMPYLVTLATSPYVSFPPAWNSQFLFSAASVFASVVLSRDVEPAHERHRRATPVTKNCIVWPDEELDWFASTLVDVVETFDLVSHGTFTHTARTCKTLLVALCTSRETLRERFRERERMRREEVLGHRRTGGDGGGGDSRRRSAGELRHKRSAGLPAVFSSSSASQSPSNGNDLRRSAAYSHGAAVTPTAAVENEGQSTYSSGSSGFTPISASEVLASMATSANTSTAAPPDHDGMAFGTTPMNGFEFAFLDPQEWARLTANLVDTSGILSL